MNAPHFQLPDQTNTLRSLEDAKGQWLVVFFYPRDSTPGCTVEAGDFQRLLPAFKKKNALVYGISQGKVKGKEKFACSLGLTYPILADEDKDVCKAFGIWKPKKFMGKEFLGIVRSTFLIGPDGAIVKHWDKVSVKGHAEEVLAEIK